MAKPKKHKGSKGNKAKKKKNKMKRTINKSKDPISMWKPA